MLNPVELIQKLNEKYPLAGFKISECETSAINLKTGQPVKRTHFKLGTLFDGDPRGMVLMASDSTSAAYGKVTSWIAQGRPTTE